MACRQAGILLAVLALLAFAGAQEAQQLQIEQPAEQPQPVNHLAEEAVQQVPADETQINGEYQATGEGGQAVITEQQSEVSTDSAFGLGDWGAMDTGDTPAAAEGGDFPTQGTEADEAMGPGCQVNPLNQQLCGGKDHGYCEEEAKTCVCHEIDDKTGWFGDACECGFAKADCNPQHCFWCESVHECVLDQRDCQELEQTPEANDLREGEDDEGSYDEEERSYDDEDDTQDQQSPEMATLDIDREDAWAGGSMSTLLFFVLLIGATGVAFYFIRAKGMSRARREYGQLRSEEL